MGGEELLARSEVLLGEQAPRGAHLARNPTAEPALVELAIAATRQLLQEGCELRVSEALAGSQGAPIGLVECPTRGSKRHDRLQEFEKVGLAVVHEQPVPRQANSRCDHVAERQTPQSALHVQVAAQVPRHRARAVPGIEQLVRTWQAHRHRQRNPDRSPPLPGW